MDLPTGTVSFLFTDVEGSTRLLDELGAGYDVLVEEHRDILRTAVERHGGAVMGTEGDAVFAAFSSATDAVAAAQEAQRSLTAHPWRGGCAFRVRMGVHTGEVRLVGEDYYGMALHVTARVCSAGHGGQVLLTGSTSALVSGVEVRALGDHRLKDMTEAISILQLLGEGLAEQFPPLRTLSARPNNLPASTDEFIGRTVELASVVDALDRHRLVTLIGTGGSGKTRLSLVAAESLLEAYPDGAWFVELGPLSDASLIPAQTAAALGHGERAGMSLQDSLVEWLRDRQALVVLDNCEHLVEGAARFADALLRSCPRLRILATSREVLRVRGERALRVPPLGLADEAPELLLTRAEAAVPGFDRGAVDRLLLEQVCRRLDGLPLAIELAAARLRSLSLADLAARLDDRFRLLSGGGRTAPTRQRTLAAVVDWSYGLLAEPDRELFRSLSVFPDGFTIESVAAVVGADDVDVIDGLGRLVEKSLVVPADGRSGRFQLLETLRQYGRDRLVDCAEEQARRQGLLTWAMSQVEQLERDLRTPRMDATLAAVMPERANLRAAMDWAIEQGDLSAALRLATTVPVALTTDRRALIGDLLARAGREAPDDVVARAQLTLGDLAFEQGDWAAAAEAAGAARLGFVRLGDRQRAAWAAHVHSSGIWGAGDLASLDGMLAELLDEFRAIGDDYGIAQTVWRMSLRESDRAAATALAIEAERRYRELGSPMMRAHALEARGLVELEAGDLVAAAPFLRESMAVLAGSGNLGCTAHALEAVAVWAGQRGDPTAAGELVGAAAVLRAASGAGHKPWEIRARHGGDYDDVVLDDTEEVRRAVARGRTHSLESAASLADEVLAAAVATLGPDLG